MGARGTKSGAELTATVQRKRGAGPVVAVIDSTRQRLKPPSGLPEDAKRLFDEIVRSCDARHFRPAERPLLLAYVRALLIERHFGSQISGDKVHFGFNTWERAVKVCATLATKLRLCPHSRHDARQAQRQGLSIGKPVWEFDGNEDE